LISKLLNKLLNVFRWINSKFMSLLFIIIDHIDNTSGKMITYLTSNIIDYYC